MSVIPFRGFVCDEDSQHLSNSFPPDSIVTLAQIGITIGRGSPDKALLDHAREHGVIIVTGNKSDFALEMVDAAKRCTPARCYEGGGMITVPSGLQRFSYRKILRALRFNGEEIDFEDVFVCNLHVDVYRDGSFIVKRLPLCEFFQRDHVAECERCRRLGIAS